MPPRPSDIPHSPVKIMLIIFSLAMGGFGIGTGEFAIMGLMPNVAQDLGVTEPQVGHLISAYALGVVVGAPLLAIFGARLFRRHLLISLMGFYALGNLASRAVGWILLWSTGMLLLFPLATGSVWTMLVICFLVALMVALGPALQTHLMDVADGAQTLAAASHHAAFNLANALGPWLGGLAISAGLGWNSTGYVGAATAVAGLGIFLLAWKQQSGAEDGQAVLDQHSAPQDC